MIEKYVKDTLRNLQKLVSRTPPCVIYFLGGHLPASAVLHLRQLSLFNMICQLKDSVLYKMSEYQLTTSKFNNGSWIMRIRELCIQYQLPSPLDLLYNPPPKTKFKSMVKSHVVNYWEIMLRFEAAQLRSLVHFKPLYISLVKPHPIWTTCGSNPIEVNKAVTQARLLSGRYCTDQLARHWSKNREVICLLTGCSGDAIEL